MSKLDEIFESYIEQENLGRIYRGNNEHIRRIYQDFNDSVKLQQQRTSDLPVPVLYITNLTMEFSVFTFKEQGHYFIGINIDAIESLFKFFQFLYSQPYFDKEFGDITKEKESPLNLSLNPDYLLDYFYNYDINVQPNCITRKSRAYTVFYKAINYLLLHEYAHITHGHLDYLSRGKKHYMYYEKDIVGNKISNIEKAMESDADSAATVYSLSDHTLELMFGNQVFSEHNMKITTQDSAVAVFFLNKLTDLTDYEIEDYAYKSHPAADQRTYDHGALVYTFLDKHKEQFNFDIDSFYGSSIGETIKSCMLAYSKMFHKNLLDDKSLFFSSKQGVPYINSIRNGWNEVRDRLEKFSYVNIAPYDVMISGENLKDYSEILNIKRDKNVDSSGEI